MVRAIPKWATAHPEAAAALAAFVAAEMPATMSAGQKAARAIARSDNAETVLTDTVSALPAELRAHLLAELSKDAES